MENYLKAFTLFIDVIPKHIFKNMPLQAQVENVIIFDVSTITLKHLIKFKISALRIYMKFTQVLKKKYQYDCIYLIEVLYSPGCYTKSSYTDSHN